jgi:hypothetical protein
MSTTVHTFALDGVDARHRRDHARASRLHGRRVAGGRIAGDPRAGPGRASRLRLRFPTRAEGPMLIKATGFADDGNCSATGS